MSEQTKIFRGDHAPEAGQVDAVAPKRNAPAHEPEPVPVAEAPKAEAPAPSPEPAPDVHAAPPLDFQLDESQLFHTPEAVRQRMAQLASAAHATAHLLDEQAEDGQRIAKRLRSL